MLRLWSRAQLLPCGVFFRDGMSLSLVGWVSLPTTREKVGAKGLVEEDFEPGLGARVEMRVSRPSGEVGAFHANEPENGGRLEPIGEVR
jgi:hypothetical protein